jgi:hypothetical protein
MEKATNRELEIVSFIEEFGMLLNKKKKKLLMEMSVQSFETFKLGVRISNCCKVIMFYTFAIWKLFLLFMIGYGIR